MRIIAARRRWLAAALLVPAAASAQTYPRAQGARAGPAEAQGPAQDLHGVQEEARCDFRTIQKAVDKATRRRHDPRAQRRLPRGGEDQRQRRSATCGWSATAKHPDEGRCCAPTGNMQNGDLRQRRRRGHRRRLHGPRLQVQRVLLHEPQRLHDEPPDRAPDRRLRPVRVQHHRRRDASTPRPTTSTTARSTSGRRRRRPSRSARSSRNVDGWGSPLGFSATNMRYVTITKSRFYNNALGIVPERAGLARSTRRPRTT